MFSPSPSDGRHAVKQRRAVAAFVALLVLGAAAAFFATSGRGSATAPAKWSFAPPMPHRRSYTASAEIGGKVYVATGMVGNTGRPLDLFERFDPATASWTSLTPAPAAFSAAAGATLRNRMYVIGGNGAAGDKGADGRQVYVYDVGSRRWSRAASLPAPRTNLAAVALGGKIYAVGGLDPFHATNTLFVYHPSRNRWSRAAQLPEALHAVAAVAFKGELWVIGGRDLAGAVTHRVWIYNPRRDRWRAGPRMPTPMETAGAAVAGGRIYVVLESVTLTYDPRTHRWSRGPSLEVPRHALAVYAIGGTLYAVGGCVAPQLEDSSVVEKLRLS
jgi:N-acetylneuraminic acid mutarotase